MAKTLKRDVYLDGFLLAAGTELTAEQEKQITNPKATEDLAIPGQDGKPTDDDKDDDDKAAATARKVAPAAPVKPIR